MPRGRPDLTGAAHRKRRATALASGVCIICGKPINPDLPGTHPMGGTLEHIIPVSRGGHPTHPDNLAASHRTCNYRRGTKLLSELPPTERHSRDWGTTTNTPPPTTRTVTLITGPPGSGKTTLAQHLHTTKGLTPLEREQYPTDRHYQQAAGHAANNPTATLTIIRCCPTTQEQHQWQTLTAATSVTTLNTPLDECIRRITQRARPGWQGEIAAARRWHQQRTGTTTTATPTAGTSREW